jgi:hypothetical protein
MTGQAYGRIDRTSRGVTVQADGAVTLLGLVGVAYTSDGR